MIQFQILPSGAPNQPALQRGPFAAAGGSTSAQPFDILLGMFIAPVASDNPKATAGLAVDGWFPEAGDSFTPGITFPEANLGSGAFQSGGEPDKTAKNIFWVQDLINLPSDAPLPLSTGNDAAEVPETVIPFLDPGKLVPASDLRTSQLDPKNVTDSFDREEDETSFLSDPAQVIPVGIALPAVGQSPENVLASHLPRPTALSGQTPNQATISLRQPGEPLAEPAGSPAAAERVLTLAEISQHLSAALNARLNAAALRGEAAPIIESTIALDASSPADAALRPTLKGADATLLSETAPSALSAVKAESQPLRPAGNEIPLRATIPGQAKASDVVVGQDVVAEAVVVGKESITIPAATEAAKIESSRVARQSAVIPSADAESAPQSVVIPSADVEPAPQATVAAATNAKFVQAFPEKLPAPFKAGKSDPGRAIAIDTAHPNDAELTAEFLDETADPSAPDANTEALAAEKVRPSRKQQSEFSVSHAEVEKLNAGRTQPAAGVNAPSHNSTPQPLVWNAQPATEGVELGRMPHLMEQMRQAAEVIAERAEGSIRLGERHVEARLNLHPPDLGNVRLDLQVGRNQTIHASFVVEHVETARLLERYSGQLTEALTRQGLTVERIQVTTQSNSTGGDARGGSEGQSGRRENLNFQRRDAQERQFTESNFGRGQGRRGR